MTACRIVLTLVHLCYSLWIFLKLCWYQSKCILRRGRWTARCKPLTSGDLQSSRFNKLPVHVALVIVEDKISLVDIANIIVWSTAVGISYVTLYDHKGNCKRNREILQSKLEEQQHQLLYADCPKRTINIFNECAGPQSHIGSYNDRPCIRVLGPEDGRQELVRLTQRITTAVAEKQLLLADVTTQYVDSSLQAGHEFPDPDLVLKFGTLDSLLGFLPWQVRLSEILSVPSHHNFNFTLFVDTLQAFGDTQQRFGK